MCAVTVIGIVAGPTAVVTTVIVNVTVAVIAAVTITVTATALATEVLMTAAVAPAVGTAARRALVAGVGTERVRRRRLRRGGTARQHGQVLALLRRALRNTNLTESEIDEFDEALLGDENVVRLQVPVDHVQVVVQVAQRQHQLRRIHARHVLRQTAHVL